MLTETQKDIIKALSKAHRNTQMVTKHKAGQKDKETGNTDFPKELEHLPILFATVARITLGKEDCRLIAPALLSTLHSCLVLHPEEYLQLLEVVHLKKKK